MASTMTARFGSTGALGLKPRPAVLAKHRVAAAGPRRVALITCQATRDVKSK